MYFSIFTLLIIVSFAFYYLWQSKRNSDNDLNIVNLLEAVAYIEKKLQIHKGLEDKKHQYAFLIQYVQDMQNLKVSDLNNKWVGIYNFFSTRTRYNGNIQPIGYTKHGRISPNTVIFIADMYKTNSAVIGAGVWEDYFNDMVGKSKFKTEDYYPKNIEDIIETIEIYDKNYTGHVMMEKRQTSKE